GDDRARHRRPRQRARGRHGGFDHRRALPAPFRDRDAALRPFRHLRLAAEIRTRPAEGRRRPRRARDHRRPPRSARAMSDRRLTPANGRVAHVSLAGRVEAERFVAGEPARVAVALADLLARPDGPRDRQVLMGERVNVLDRDAGFAFVQAEKDGYCGYLAAGALAEDRAATHWVAAPATHLYHKPNLKTPKM